MNNILWYIKFVPSKDTVFMRSDGTFTVGVCDNETKIIYIDSSLRGNFLKKVLCHEIAHAAMFSYGVNITIEQEEILADIIATYGEDIINITNKIFQKIKEM